MFDARGSSSVSELLCSELSNLESCPEHEVPLAQSESLSGGPHQVGTHANWRAPDVGTAAIQRVLPECETSMASYQIQSGSFRGHLPLVMARSEAILTNGRHPLVTTHVIQMSL